MLGYLDVVVAVDAEYLLDDIGLATHVDTIGRYGQSERVALLRGHFYVERIENRAHRRCRNILADKAVGAVERELYDERLGRRGVYVDYVARYLAACELLHKQCGTFERIYLNVGVDAALEAERSVGVKAETLGRLANPDGVEVRAFEEHVDRAVAYARVQAAVDAGDAHRTLGRAYHKVAVGKFALHAVERDERRTFGACLDDDASALDLVGIESMERLPQLEEHVVGYVDQIVFGVDACGAQLVLHPVGRGRYLAVADCETGVTRCRLAVLDRNADRKVAVVDLERIDRRQQQAGVIVAAAAQICRKVACDAYVRRSVDTVGREAYGYQEVVLDMQILLSGHTHASIGRKLHDALVAPAYAELVLGAEHAERLDAAYLAALDLELLLAAARVEHAADGGAQHFQTLAAVVGAADDLERSLRTHVDRGYVEVVGIGMILACQHLGHDHTGQPAADRLYLLEAFDLQSYVGQYLRYALGRQIGRDILLQPVVRNVHIVMILSVFCQSYKGTNFSVN